MRHDATVGREPGRPSRARARGRRRLAIAVVALAAGVVAAAGLVRWFWPGDVRTGSVAAHGATILRYDVHSRWVHATLPQTAVLPAGGGAGRPLLVFLHGRGPDGQESNANSDFFAALKAVGARAPAVVFPNGSVSSYYHRRASGDWARYVLDEVIPQAVARLKADPHRVAIGGISMGGFGAFDLARQRPRRFCAVGGHSPALWLRAGDTAPGAFDDAADFARNDVVGLARSRGRAPWGRARLWLDGGTADPFRAGGDALAAALGIRIHHPAGGHDGHYWRAHYARYLRFYAAALAAC
jgi:S-formylglutathione hydrolase FrmB